MSGAAAYSVPTSRSPLVETVPGSGRCPDSGETEGNTSAVNSISSRREGVTLRPGRNRGSGLPRIFVAPSLPLLSWEAWVKANLPRDARVGSWNAGLLGFLSDRQVVNLDGLVNPWEYLEVEQYDLCAYWEKMGITHLVDAFEPGPPPVVVPVAMPMSRFYARCADRLELLWRDGPEGLSWRISAYRIRPEGE